MGGEEGNLIKSLIQKYKLFVIKIYPLKIFLSKKQTQRVHTKSDHNFSSYIYSQENCISGLYLFSAAAVIKDHLLKGLFNCSLAAEHSVLAGSVIALALRGYVLCSQRLCHLAGEEAKRGERVNHFSIDFLWI